MKQFFAKSQLSPSFLFSSCLISTFSRWHSRTGKETFIPSYYPRFYQNKWRPIYIIHSADFITFYRGVRPWQRTQKMMVYASEKFWCFVCTRRWSPAQCPSVNKIKLRTSSSTWAKLCHHDAVLVSMSDCQMDKHIRPSHHNNICSLILFTPQHPTLHLSW